MSAVDFTSVNFTGRAVKFTIPFLLTRYLDYEWQRAHYSSDLF